jgi:hypothetical protein
MSRRIQFAARLVGGAFRGRTVVGKPVHRGVVTLEPHAMVWNPGALSRAFFVRHPIAFEEVLHVQVIDGFWGAANFFPNAGTGSLVGFQARGAALTDALRATGYEVSTNPSWPGMSVAVPRGRVAVWTSEGPWSEPAA